MKKTILILLAQAFLALSMTACAGSAPVNKSSGSSALPVRSTSVPSGSGWEQPPQNVSGGGDVMISVPYKKEANGTTWSWQLFQPAIPKDVPKDIFIKLWNINVKTIKAGKYDYNAFNFNTAQFITYDESAMSNSFTFAGVCMNYADYFIFVLKHDKVLSDLYAQGVITSKSSPSHKWVEYHTAQNRYIIDPTWCDWDFIGEPQGMYAGNAQFSEACRTSYNKEKIMDVKSKSWFFRNVRTVTDQNDRRAHGL